MFEPITIEKIKLRIFTPIINIISTRRVNIELQIIATIVATRSTSTLRRYWQRGRSL